MKEAPSITLNALLELIEHGRNAELCRDTHGLSEILKDVWSDIETAPVFDFENPEINAELLRLSGVFLSFYGLAQNLQNYQLRGKDTLTNAIEAFEKLGIHEKTAEARINLAFCYWNLGEVKEADTIIEIVEETFGKNPLNPVYLQICVNRLMICFFNRQIEEGLKLIQQIETPMNFCADMRLQAMFHTQAGILLTIHGEYEKGIFHHNEAIRFAKKTNNEMYVGMNLNNLAFLYKEIEDFGAAFENISAAIQTFAEIGHRCFLAHALDTKALIFLDRGASFEALDTINQSIEIFGQGEDYRGLTDALWTKIRILRRLGRFSDSFVVFAELAPVARERIGESAVRKFADLFAAEEKATPTAGQTYDERVENFQKSLIRAALAESNGAVGKAARLLGFPDHKKLSNILRTQFPDVRREFGLDRRRRRRSLRPSNEITVLPAASRTITLDACEIHYETEIAPVDLQGKKCIFNFSPPADCEYFYFDKYQMRLFGIDEGAVIAAGRAERITEGTVVIARVDNTYLFGTVFYDGFHYYYIDDKQFGPVILQEQNIIGEAVAFCPMEQTDENFIEFSRLK